MRILVRFVVASLCITLFPSIAAAQATLAGTVRDASGAVLPGVTLTVRNQDTGMFRETISNEDGTYFVSGIVPGMYQIEAEIQGFKKYVRRDVRLEIGITTHSRQVPSPKSTNVSA